MKALVNEAKRIAEALQGDIANIKGELAEVEHEKINLEDKLHHANLAHNRFLSFQPTIDGKLQCPECWIRKGVHSNLSAVDSDRWEDRFLCRTCHWETYIAP